jgi:hypothetical protein
VANGSGSKDGHVVIDYRECTDDNGDNDDNNDNKEEGGGDQDNNRGRATKTTTTTMPPLSLLAFGVQRFLDCATGARLPLLGMTGQKRGGGGGQRRDNDPRSPRMVMQQDGTIDWKNSGWSEVIDLTRHTAAAARSQGQWSYWSARYGGGGHWGDMEEGEGGGQIAVTGGLPPGF